jgi:2-hydroxychromene-2-carboxylate isomerase
MSENNAAKTVEFFWDPASPYTYLAATQIDELAARTGAIIDWKPFLLGKVFEGSSNRMPASVPAKAKHMFKDLQLWAKLYGVPLTMPKVFPVNSVLACRVGVAANAIGKGGDYAQAIMRAYWGEGIDISQPENVAAAITDAGLDTDSLLAEAQGQPIKDQLRANTEDALARGAFGAPTFFIGKQMFWGNDRLVLLEGVLSGKLAA